jgi:undecaprenyl-diphosphatase
LNFTTATLLSLVEGLTEFIPVSSTGHLVLLASSLGNNGEVEKFFEVFIQLGAIIAVLILYHKKIFILIDKLFNAEINDHIVGYSALSIIISCVPSLVLGFLFYKYIKGILFYPTPIALALIVGGILLILVEKKSNSPNLIENSEVISVKQALIIGFFQCLSLWPGMSRSGSCIIGARIAGVSRTLSAEFSFIVALPTIFAAVLYDSYKNIHLFFSPEIGIFLYGFILALIFGLISIKFFISYLERFSLVPFGIYRIVLGATVLLIQYFSFVGSNG